MTGFLFQGNPDRFHLDDYLKDAESAGSHIMWAVAQHKRDIRIGDTAYIWRAAGRKTKAIPGVVAVGRVMSAPRQVPIDSRFWSNDDDAMEDKPRVEIDLMKVMIGTKEVIKREWMKEDPILKSMKILRMAQNTNYQLADDEQYRLDQLVQNTGVVWSRAESMAALWLYNELYAHSISRTSESRVAEVAVKIGRAVSGVYNKVMNYRSIDPRDNRKGLSGINKVDQAVWDIYFDQQTDSIRQHVLAEDYERIWGGDISEFIASATQQDNVPSEAPNDEIRRKKSVSVLVRKGQSAFRKRLLHVYDGKCAISEVDVVTVLDAAHIDDYARSGVNDSTNGLLLRSDFHDLFDAGLLTIDPDTLVIRVDSSLSQSYYAQFDGKTIRERVDGERPSKQALKTKNRSGD